MREEKGQEETVHATLRSPSKWRKR